MNIKKSVIIILSTCLVIGAAAGGTHLYKKNQAASNLVEVFPISSHTTENWADTEQSYGRVSTNMDQKVYYSEEDIIQEILVKEGQEVTVGTPLIQYDTSLTQLEVEKAEANLSLQRTYRESLTAFITQLKNTKPVSSSASVPNSSAFRLLAAGKTLSEASAVTYSYIQTSDNLTANPGDGDITDPAAQEPTTTTTPETTSPSDITTESPTTVPAVQTPINLRTSLSEGDEADAGSGTEDDPYRYYITPDVSISSGFYYYLIMSQETAVIQIRSLKSTSIAPVDATLENTNPLYNLTFNGGEVSSSIFSETDEGDEGYEPEDGFSDVSGGEDLDDSEDYLNDASSFPVDISGYTKEELAKELAAREEELVNLDLNIRKAELNLEKLNKKMEGGTVVSTVSGKIKTLNTVEDVKLSGDPLLVASGEEDFYVSSTISESYLDTVKVGQTVSLTSWDTRQNYEGKITYISDTPTQSTYSAIGQNPNSSGYECTIALTGSSNLKNGDYLDISFLSPSEEGMASSGIFLDVRFISEEDNGSSYVYKVGEDGRLTKQKVTTGRIIYEGEYIEILDGLTMDDYISYPFGKSVKEGAKVSGIDEDALTDSTDDMQGFNSKDENNLDKSNMQDDTLVDDPLKGSSEDSDIGSETDGMKTDSDGLNNDELESGNNELETSINVQETGINAQETGSKHLGACIDTNSDAAAEAGSRINSDLALVSTKELCNYLYSLNQFHAQGGMSIC